jgi:threonine dehydratase
MPGMNEPRRVTRDDVDRAAAIIAGHVRRTPVIDLDGVTVKLELLQHAGSFKTRGAAHRLLSTPDIPAAGVITASGGNHGAALAWVAQRLGVPAEVFVPSTSPLLKRENIARFGATVTVVEGYYDEAKAAADVRAAETGALFVHAFDHPDTVAGQGTMAKELSEQAGPVDTLLVACGGGGFIAGQAAWFAGTATRVVGVEPESSRALHAAIAAGAPVEVPVSGLAADSLGAQRIGAVPWATLRGVVTRCVLVDDDAIRTAQRELWSLLRLVVEPGGAAAWAALRSGAYTPERGERVVLALCGANGDPIRVVSP